MGITDNFKVNVTGTSYNNRQGKLWNLRKNADKAYVSLSREPKNPADPNAIKVIAHIKGQRPFDIGYLPAKVAKELAPVIDNGSARPWIEGFETSVTTRNNQKWVLCNIVMRLIPNYAVNIAYENR